MVVTGVAWIALMASFNVGAQTAAPAWVSARALGAYWLVFQRAMAAGSALWRWWRGRSSRRTDPSS
jgi:hypothetical protein